MESSLETAQDNWTIRAARGDEIAFIFATWLNSYRADSMIGRDCRKSIFYRAYGKVIDYILEKPETTVTIAVPTHEPDTMIGYLVREPDRVHYIFVKEIFQRNGIARSLLKASGGGEPFVITHRTGCVRPILDAHPEITYNPFLLFNQGVAEWD